MKYKIQSKWTQTGWMQRGLVSAWIHIIHWLCTNWILHCFHFFLFQLRGRNVWHMPIKSGQQLYVRTNTPTADLQETTSYPPEHCSQSQRQGVFISMNISIFQECIFWWFWSVSEGNFSSFTRFRECLFHLYVCVRSTAHVSCVAVLLPSPNQTYHMIALCWRESHIKTAASTLFFPCNRVRCTVRCN